MKQRLAACGKWCARRGALTLSIIASIAKKSPSIRLPRRFAPRNGVVGFCLAMVAMIVRAVGVLIVWCGVVWCGILALWL